jgi:hypothetical protein
MRRLFVLGLAVACAPQSDGDCMHWFYADADGDGHGVSIATLRGCVAPPGYETTNDDCDDSRAAIHPGAEEVCNGIDDNCDRVADLDATDRATWYVDADLDGFGDDATVTTGCGAPSWSVPVGGDCDDQEPAVWPGTFEICNEVDDDCDTLIDADDPGVTDAIVWYADADLDQYGDPATGVLACAQPLGSSPDPSDCDDGAVAVHPGAEERCNGFDDDCDGLLDDADPDVSDQRSFYGDADGDGVGAPGVAVLTCFPPKGYVGERGDCDDGDPAAVEEILVYRDHDEDGYGSIDQMWSVCGEIPDGAVAVSGDCDDWREDVFPDAAEICNDVDDNCDDLVDEDDPLIGWPTYFADTDGDGYGDPSVTTTPTSCDRPSGYVRFDGDCGDHDTWVHPSALEYCDGKDNDCNGAIDDAVVSVDWYDDDDGDGYGDDVDTLHTCEIPEGYVLERGDCDDASPTTHLGGTEVCMNGADDDCDGRIDPCPFAIEDADFTLRGTRDTFSGLGSALDVGDLDADGVLELVVGAPRYEDPRVHAIGPPSSTYETVYDADQTFVAWPGSGLGESLAAADADGDGDDDLLLGAPGLDAAFLFLGPLTSGGHVATADASLMAPSRGLVGHVTDVVPDHDGHGSPDILVSAAYGWKTSRRQSVYVIAGTSTGAIDCSTGATYEYETATDTAELGASTTALGDTTGDGIEDLAIGAPGREGNAVFVVAGGEAPGSYPIADVATATLSSVQIQGFGRALDAADHDGDGYADLFVGAPQSGPSVYAFLGPLTDSRTTSAADVRWIGDMGLGFSIAAGGDVEGDGHPDVLMGAVYDTNHAGAVYLQRGEAQGVVDVGDLTWFESHDDTVLGYAVTFVPDWTGDGGAEVALGQPFLYQDISVRSGMGRVDVVFSENLY